MSTGRSPRRTRSGSTPRRPSVVAGRVAAVFSSCPTATLSRRPADGALPGEPAAHALVLVDGPRVVAPAGPHRAPHGSSRREPPCRLRGGPAYRISRRPPATSPATSRALMASVIRLVLRYLHDREAGAAGEAGPYVFRVPPLRPMPRVSHWLLRWPVGSGPSPAARPARPRAPGHYVLDATARARTRPRGRARGGAVTVASRTPAARSAAGGLALLLALDTARSAPRRPRLRGRSAAPMLAAVPRAVRSPPLLRGRGASGGLRRGRSPLPLPPLAVARPVFGSRACGAGRASPSRRQHRSEPAGPPDACRRGSALRSRWQLIHGDDAARARPARLAARGGSIGWVGLLARWTKTSAEGAIELASSTLPFGLLAGRSRASRWTRPWLVRRPRTRSRQRPWSSRRSGLPVRHARPLLEPEGHRRQRVPAASSGSTRSSGTPRSTAASSSSRSWRRS